MCIRDRAGLRAGGFLSTTWSGAYTMAGALVSANYSPHWRVRAEASFIPYHDSEYDWVMAWSAGLKGAVSRSISVICRYTTIPDYRLSERRIHAGVEFHTGALWVTPVVSVPVGSSPAQSVRLLVSCGYTIAL